MSSHCKLSAPADDKVRLAFFVIMRLLCDLMLSRNVVTARRVQQVLGKQDFQLWGV